MPGDGEIRRNSQPKSYQEASNQLRRHAREKDEARETPHEDSVLPNYDANSATTGGVNLVVFQRIGANTFNTCRATRNVTGT